MTRLRMAIWRILAIFKKMHLENDFDDEIRSHIDMLTADNIRNGMPGEEARRAALQAFGRVDRVKDLHRDARTFVVMEQLWQDIRYGIRGLAKNPGFTLFAALTLALGIGVNTTAFNAYNAIALKPIPVSDANRVMRLKRRFESHALGDLQFYFSYAEYVYCRDHNNGVFSDLIAVGVRVAPSVDLPPSAVPNSIVSGRLGQPVSANFFAGLGIVPQLGRGFLPGEDQLPGANPVIVLSHVFWKRVFGGDAQILGQSIKLNGTTFTIVGVAPPEFTGTDFLLQRVPDFWVPLSMQAQLAPDAKSLNDPTARVFQILARLSPSASLVQAQQQTSQLVRDYDATLPAPNTTDTTDSTDKTVAVALQHAVALGDTDDPRFKALAAGFMLLVGLVLLVACANIATMLLARGAARQREIAVRRALGSSRIRIVRQLLTESFLLSALGGSAGLLLAMWISRVLETTLRGQVLSTGGSGLQLNLSADARVFVYVLAVSVIISILCGVSPALRFSKGDVTSAFKDEGFASSLPMSRSRLRSGLIAVQVAVSMFFLLTAGLLVRGMMRSQAIDPGFETRNTFVLDGNFRIGLRDPKAVSARERRLVDTLRSLPELKDLAVGDAPFSGTWTPPIIIGEATSPAALKYQPFQSYRTLASYASDNYFDVVGIPLLRGRVFTRQEAALGSHIAVISESTARRFWPDQDALGKHFQLDMDFRGHLSDFEIVGIAKDVRFANLSRIDPSHVYLPTDAGLANGLFNNPNSIILKIRGDSPMPAIRRALATNDKNLLQSLALVNIEEQKSAARDRLSSQVSTALAASLAFLALTFTSAGVYGVLGYLVTQRTREIGIRMALGATVIDLLRSIIVQGLRPVFAGMMVGLLAAAGLSFLLHSTLAFPGSVDFLYGVPFYDPVTFLGLSCFVLGLAALASLVPSRRALRVDPMVALRHE